MEGRDGGVVDVPEQEVVHGPVPVARVLVEGRAVPPRGVEAPVGEVGQFREEVELSLLVMILLRTTDIGCLKGGTYNAVPYHVPSQQMLNHEWQQ